jgi:hypothetical protein
MDVIVAVSEFAWKDWGSHEISHGRDLNPRNPECEADVFPSRRTRSTHLLWVICKEALVTYFLKYCRGGREDGQINGNWNKRNNNKHQEGVRKDNRKCLSLYQIVTCKTACDRQKSSDLSRSVETVYKTEWRQTKGMKEMQSVWCKWKKTEPERNLSISKANMWIWHQNWLLVRKLLFYLQTCGFSHRPYVILRPSVVYASHLVNAVKLAALWSWLFSFMCSLHECIYFTVK